MSRSWGCWLPNTAVIFARLDPLSLRPVSRRVRLGEYHDAWSLSPDRSRLALGVSAPGHTGRVGIVIVDLQAMKIVRQIETGGAAEALAWFAPDLLVAALVREGTVLVDPRTGKILRRWPRLSEPQASAGTRDGLVLLFPGPLRATDEGEGTAAPRLAVVDAAGRLRSVVLERMQLGVRYREGVGFADEAGLAVDPNRERAYVFAANAPVADVDLGTMRVSYHRLEPLFLRPGELRGAAVQPEDVGARIRRAFWLGDGHVLVFGRDLVLEGREGFDSNGAGATLVDTAQWKSCMLDARGGSAAFVEGRLLVYGGRDPSSTGLRGYTIDGREAFDLLDRIEVWNAQPAGEVAYLRTRTAVYIVDVVSGNVLSEIKPPVELVDVVAGGP